MEIFKFTIFYFRLFCAIFIVSLTGTYSFGTESTSPSPVEIISNLTSEDATTRAMAIQQAERSNLKEAVEPLLKLIDDPIPTVGYAALLVAARIDGLNIANQLQSLLTDSRSYIREAAALGLLLYGGGLETNILQKARAQVITKSGLLWLEVLDGYRKTFNAKNELYAQLRKILEQGKTEENKICIQEQIDNWTELGLKELPGLEELNKALRRGDTTFIEDVFNQIIAISTKLDTQMAYNTNCVPSTVPEPENPELSNSHFWTDKAGENQFVGYISSSLDGNTSPFAFRDKPLNFNDNFNDSSELGFTLTGGIRYRSGYGITQREHKDWLSIDSRDNHLFIDVNGGYNFRPQIDAFQHPFGVADLTYSKYFPYKKKQTNHLQANVTGGLIPVTRFSEEDMTLYPALYAGGTATIGWSRNDIPHSDELFPVERMALSYRGGYGHYLENEDIELPETQFNNHLVRAAFFLPMPDFLTLGLELNGRFRHSPDSDFDSGGGALMLAMTSDAFPPLNWNLSVGYGALFPFNTDQTNPEHGVVAQAGFFSDIKVSRKMGFRYGLSLEHSLLPSNRDSFAVTSDRGSFFIRFKTPSMFTVFDVELYFSRGKFVNGTTTAIGGIKADLPMPITAATYDWGQLKFRLHYRYGRSALMESTEVVDQLTFMLIIDLYLADI